MNGWLALFFVTAGAEAPSAEDFLSIRWIGDPVASPAGDRWVFREGGRSFDPDATHDKDRDTDSGWKRQSQLYLVDRQGDVRQLTRGEESPGHASWAPDGERIAFTRSVGDDTVLHLLPVDGGEPILVETDDLDAGSWAWQADDRLAFLATPSDKDQKEADWIVDGAHRWSAQFENAVLHSVTLDGDPEPITDGETHVVSFKWSAAAGAFAVREAPSADPYRVLAEPSLVLLGEERVVLSENPPCLGDYEWSPDGSHLAWTECAEGISVAQHVRVHRISDGKTWRIADDLDPTIASIHWMPDGRSILANVQERTETRVYRLPRDGGDSRDIGFSGGEIRGGIEVGPQGKWAAIRYVTDHHPARLCRFNLKNGDIEIIRDPNPHIGEWALGETEVFTWKNGEIALEGLLTRPLGAEGPTPLLVLPHGGPDSVSTIGFNSWAHFFSTHGYAVFRPNYQGGTAYGTVHYTANRGRLGEIEFGDIESGVDALIAAGLATEDRLFYGGWSWGGYLTAWTIGHTPRYRAAVAGAAVVDVVNQYVTSDINHGVVADWEYNGRPWEDLALFDASDPSRSLGAVTTPTLILHGDADRRVPFSQGLTLYRALSDIGVETELWVYPGQGHGLKSGAHNAHRLKTWLAWYDAHLESR